MSGTDPVAVLTQLGQLLLVDKFFLTAAKCLWIYDYLLTFGDEVRYAWSGRKSGVFALFIAVRYTPVVHFIYVYLSLFVFGTPNSCRYTKWVPVFNSSAATTFSHMAVALRIYAITRRNKFLAGALAVIIAAEACWNLYSIIRIALGPVQLFPALGLDPFHICVTKSWEVQELAFYGLAMFFEAFAFSILVVTAVRSRMGGFIAVPTILSVILRDATQYFVVIFTVHILSLIFLFLAPIFIKLLPGKPPPNRRGRGLSTP
ncbi:hypothetical protein BJ322DRAFT_149896 [Thelephora terrestris]|uniref:DUF6533 domain-containing protein n=1 Tax=Thelephora terrestris TaxID=56493 RepID=A0A9P6HCT8_9AGAM|nr:hypothetical protein BJ322DRAFT_149896 [Thelephora terrestris]